MTSQIQGLRPRLFAGAGVLALISVATVAQAQTAPPVYDRDHLASTQVEALIVTGRGYAEGRALSATRTVTPIVETPLSVQVVTRETLQDQQAVQLIDAIRNVSGVAPGMINGGFSEEFTIRGFNTGFTNYVDGYRFPATRVPLAIAEQVEVVKGAAANLFGRIEPGGLINTVLKRPQAARQYVGELQVGSYDFKRAILDGTGPVTGDGSVLYRLTAEHLDQGSFRDHLGVKRTLIAPALTWKIAEGSTLDLHAFYFDEDSVDDATGVPALGTQPANIPVSRFLGEPNLDFSNTKASQVSARFRQALGTDWTLQAQLTRSTRKVTDNSTSGFDLNEASGVLTRGYFGSRTDGKPSWLGDISLTGRVTTGAWTHDLLIGVDRYDNVVNARALSLGASAINIFAPVYGASGVNLNQPDNRFYYTSSQWTGFYLQDQIAVGRWRLLLGGRYDDATFRSGTIRSAAGSPAAAKAGANRLNSKRFNPRVGLLYEVTPSLSAYASYAESVGAANGARDASGAQIDPEFGRQYEAGLKGQAYEGRLIATLALYDLAKQNVAVPVPGTDYSANIGKSRSRGVEVDVTGRLTPNLSAIATYAYTDAEVVEGADAGSRLFNAPKNSGSLWLTYDTAPQQITGWRFGGGVWALSTRQGDNQGSFELPGFSRWDAFASYRFLVAESPVTVQVNVQNLFDETYYLSAGGFRTNITPGAPRSVTASIRTAF